MQAARDHLAKAMSDETSRYARSVLDASASVFCWIDNERQVVSYERSGICSAGWLDYINLHCERDPLNIPGLLRTQTKIAFLEQERWRRSEEDVRVYAGFQDRYGLSDEVDFIFWHNGCPIAALAVVKMSTDPPFKKKMVNLEEMRHYFEFALCGLPHVRKYKVSAILEKRFGLSPREVTVAQLLNNGMSNAAIATVLGVGLATVKTYVLNIFDKLGVESRAAVIAFCATL